jgi:hypothetical protein
MKSKIMLGLATLASLAIPSFAQQTYCRSDADGDRQICTTTGYDMYGNYYERSFSRPVYSGSYGNGYGNGYYGGSYNNGYYSNGYNGGYYSNGYSNGYYGYGRDAWRHREHEEHERRERMEHQRHEWREHHRDRDDYR